MSGTLTPRAQSILDRLAVQVCVAVLAEDWSRRTTLLLRYRRVLDAVGWQQ